MFLTQQSELPYKDRLAPHSRPSWPPFSNRPMLLASLPQVSFRCPGEEYEIPAAVHRARLAAGYEKCAHCPQRGPETAGVTSLAPSPANGAGGTPGVAHCHVTSQLATSPLVRSERATGPAETIWQSEGVRGVYLNQVDRPLARTIAIAFAEHLQHSPPLGNPPSPAPPSLTSLAGLTPPQNSPATVAANGLEPAATASPIESTEHGGPRATAAAAPPPVQPEAGPLPRAEPLDHPPRRVACESLTHQHPHEQRTEEQPTPLPASWPESLSERIRLLTASDTPHAALRVLLGHDERSCSPELAAAAGLGLRQMGCQVVDLGLISRPALAREIRIQQATGGMLLTGSGCDHEFVGCDLLGPQGEPLSAPGRLADVHRRWRATASPAPRTIGRLTSRRPSAGLPAGWQSLLHGLRPLRIAWGCGQPQATAELRSMLSQTACQLVPVAWGARARRLMDRSDPDLVQLRRQLLEQSCHLGIAVGDDGQQCHLLDEQGNSLEVGVVLRALNGPASRTVAIAQTLEEAWRIRRDDRETPVTAGPAGYYWLPGPECDALRLLLHVLRWLSDSDEPTSRRFLNARPTPTPATASKPPPA